MRKFLLSIGLAVAFSALCITPLPAFAVNQPPVADAGTDQLIEADEIGGADVLLDGTGSYDLDGDPLEFSWTGVGLTTGMPVFFEDNTSEITIAFCQLENSAITLTVTDSEGNSDSATVFVDVVDTTPPEVTVQRLTNRVGKPLPVYVASATDIAWEPQYVEIFIVDTGAGTVWGPFSSGVTFQYIVAPGATPSMKPSKAPNKEWVITAQGPGEAFAVDASGNVSDSEPLE